MRLAEGERVDEAVGCASGAIPCPAIEGCRTATSRDLLVIVFIYVDRYKLYRSSSGWRLGFIRMAKLPDGRSGIEVGNNRISLFAALSTLDQSGRQTGPIG
jgi:hypothetical protein